MKLHPNLEIISFKERIYRCMAGKQSNFKLKHCNQLLLQGQLKSSDLKSTRLYWTKSSKAGYPLEQHFLWLTNLVPLNGKAKRSSELSP